MGADPDTDRPKPKEPHGWRFSLRGLLVLSSCVGVCLAFVRWWGAPGFVGFVVFAVPVWILHGKPTPGLWALRFLAAYGAVSMLTLPFVDALWLGEIPVLALVQLPKVEFARSIRTLMVTGLMGPLGLSQGSFSPDYIAARPWALAIAYALPLSFLLAALWIRTRLRPPYRVWTIAVVAMALVDYWLTLVFAGGPGITIY